MKRLVIVFLLVIMVAPLFSGCGVSDLLSPLTGKKSSSEQGIDNAIVNPAADVYVDSKTGLIITKKQYNVYRFVDGYKKYGGYIALICFAVGVFLRIFIRTSMVIKKFSVFLFLAVPIIYITLAYLFSYLGDKA